MIELSRIEVAWGESRLRGAARVKGGEVVASLDELLERIKAHLTKLGPILDLELIGEPQGGENRERLV